MTHLLALALVVAAPPALPFEAKVVGVSDGDTISVLKPDRSQVRIRLNGVDAPESGQPFGTRAKQATSDLVFRKTVRVEPRDVDRYGRTVANVELPDGRDLGHELVRAGFAWHYVKYAPDDRELAALEKEARAARRGLWADPHPIPPWDWRRGGGLPGDLAGKIIGNRNSHVYHAPGCPNAARILEKNRVVFDTESSAERAGFRAGRDCH